ncbi:MAG: ATP-dependent Clp protease ATP-binding subunit [Candidatus Pacebacteria bacterium]|nr:ATP-dependent Clp protease ATP-binding subunit [Candidatus Paceibacterota bacterium]
MNIFPQKIQKKFTTHLKSVIKNAENISRELSHGSIEIEHIMLGMLSQKGSIGSSMLGSEKLDFKNLRKMIDNLPKVKKWKPKLSEETKDAFKKSVLVAGRYKHSHIGTEHLLYAVLLNKNAKVEEIFSRVGINPGKLKEQLKAIMESSARFFDIVDLFDLNSKSQKLNSPGQMNGNQNSGFAVEMSALPVAMNSNQSVLDCFCVDLVKEVEDGKIDSIIGREKEIDKVINILSRKTKNNPILVGEPGVGKTAIVHGLAQRISKGDVPASLIGRKIYSLDVGLLVAGAVFRGEFEARLKDVISEVQGDPNVILFIDEIHTIIGAGSAGGSGSLDAANMLKPSLSRGELSCIGATTLDEYRKQFKKDAALERRFQMVIVEEPSREDTKKMLMGLKRAYEKHHNLKINDDAVKAAVDLSSRFINDRFLPDKALDIIDEAAAFVRSKHSGNNYFKEIKKLEEKKRGLQIEKEKAIESEKYDEALIIKEEESKVEHFISKTISAQEKENVSMIKEPVSFDEVAEIITQMTGIPVKKMVSDEREKLQNLEKKLEKHIVGQHEAIGAVSKSIRRGRVGISDAKRPLGVFLFMGPTGVGKTQLAKTLADIMYERKDALIKVDMSEFMEKHNVSRLVGAPAGYVGYEEGGKLTEQVRLHPYSVILFDEIEKAHSEVFNLMLQIFEDGELTDASGRKVDFKNTTIIMTSNIGTEQLTDEARLGFAEEEQIGENERKNKIRKKYIETKESVIKEFREEFSPEFVNRIDKVLVFNPLDLSDIKSIIRIQFSDFKRRLAKNNDIKIDLDRKALDHIARKSFNPNEGARLVRRNLQEMVEDLVSEGIIEGKIEEGDSVKLSAKKDEIILQKNKKRKSKKK